MQIPQALHNGANGSSALAERESQSGWPCLGAQKTKRWETVGSRSCDWRRERCLGSRISQTWPQCLWGRQGWWQFGQKHESGRVHICPGGNQGFWVVCWSQPTTSAHLGLGFSKTEVSPGMCILAALGCKPGSALGLRLLRPLPASLPRSLGAGRKALGTQGDPKSAGTDSPGFSPAGTPLHWGLNACSVLVKETHLSLAILQPWVMQNHQYLLSCLLMVFTGRYFLLCLPKRCDAVPQDTALL